MRAYKTLILCLAMLFTLIDAGCTGKDSLGRQAVTGKVNFNGAPLEQGNIRFETQGNPGGPASGAMITSGKYTIPVENGLPPGKYLVRINVASATKSSPAGPPGPEAASFVSPELIPPEFNVKSTQVVEVRTGANEFTFDIPAKK
jgi:hypothetical protein